MNGPSPACNGGRNHALPRVARITSPDEIRALFRRGKRRKTRHLDVFVSASPVVHSRIGLVVPKPRARSARQPVRAAAVQRNRLKRRLREIARRFVLPELNASGRQLDLLVRIRPEAYDADFGQLQSEMHSLLSWLCSNDF